MNFELEKFKKFCEGLAPEFYSRPFKYIRSGISPHEAFAFCALAEFIGGLDLIIESGVAGGASTEMFAQFFPSVPIIGYETGETYGLELYEATKERLKTYPNVEIVKGNSLDMATHTINAFQGKSVGLFFDGPKGHPATRYGKKVFQLPQVRMFGQHDVCTKTGYHSMDDWDKVVFYTDAEWFQDKFRDMDGPEFELVENGGMGLAVNA
jgi:hypothetical protein